MPELAGPKWEIGRSAIGQAAFGGGDGREMSGSFVIMPEK
jgi:hypothetical protein